MNMLKNQKEYKDLVSAMMELKDKIDSFLTVNQIVKDGIEDQQHDDEDRNVIVAKQAQITLEETVQELGIEPDEILKFSFELRKQDVQNKYSVTFLTGNVRPPPLVDMIMSNKWD